MISCKLGDDCGCSFKNTGANYAEVWDEIKAVVDKKVDCEECHEHGLKQVSALRDHVKIGIGGQPFDKKNYVNFVNEVNCVFEKYSRRA